MMISSIALIVGSANSAFISFLCSSVSIIVFVNLGATGATGRVSRVDSFDSFDSFNLMIRFCVQCFLHDLRRLFYYACSYDIIL